MNIFDILFSPQHTIEKTKNRTNIILPLIFSMILVILPILLCKAEYLEFTKQTLEKVIESQGITNQMQIEMIMNSVSQINFTTYLGAMIGIVFSALIAAFAYWLLGCIVGSAPDIKFKHYFSIAMSITFITTLLVSICTIVVAKTTGIYEVDLSLNIFMPIITHRTTDFMKFVTLFIKATTVTQLWTMFIWGLTLKNYTNMKKFTSYVIAIIFGIVTILITVLPQL